MKNNYNPWPIGQVPEHLRRNEPETIKQMGYDWQDPRDIVHIFEKKVASFTGSKYAISVDCCTHAIELCFRLLLEKNEIEPGEYIGMPDHTYISPYFTLNRLGLIPILKDAPWSGIYNFKGTRIFDGAVRWRRNMFVGDDSLQCLSFQIKKRIPIGRGGMILLNDLSEYNWLQLASYDGRNLNTSYDSHGHIAFPGFHYYMTPEDAARGIILMDAIKEEGDSASWKNYPSIKTMLNI